MPQRPTSNASALTTESRELQVYELVVKGYSDREIAEKTGIPISSVKTIIIEQRKIISNQLLSLRETWAEITAARTEWLLRLILPRIEKQIEEDRVDKGLIKLGVDIMKFQNEVISPPQAANDNRVLINQTFVSSSPLYDEALQNIQVEKTGTAVHKMEEPKELPPNPKLARLEELASEFLPNGILLDDDDDDAEYR